ncbi:hypothetical protein [Bifidobacterium moukalabense]|uniref:hypothetical protein n=1 Tax=Bifidobacterium moukalabense TaxID=1333651 RepID=UPI0010F92543|nr:hypothetical protein [Bifidobacterium moukalabense]
MGMCDVDRWIVSLDDARAFDFRGAFIPAYEDRLESEDWKASDVGSAVGRHGGVYWRGRDPSQREHLLVDASGVIAHMQCSAEQTGLTDSDRRRLFDRETSYSPVLPIFHPSCPADDRRTKRKGPEAV